MDTERMIPNSRTSQNGSSPGSSGQSGPTYHNASVINNSMINAHNNGQLTVNSVARKKKTERLVPPLIPNHGGLVNGNASINNVSNVNGASYMNSTSVYSPMGNNGGVTNHGYTRESIK